MIVLDSDVLSLVQQRRGRDYAQLVSRLDSVSEPVCVTIISFEEQMRGWLALIARAKRLDRQVQVYTRLRACLEDFHTRPVLDFTEQAAAHFQ